MSLSFDYAIHNQKKKKNSSSINFWLQVLFITNQSFNRYLWQIKLYFIKVAKFKSFLLSIRGRYTLHICYSVISLRFWFSFISFSFKISLTCISFVRYISVVFSLVSFCSKRYILNVMTQ